MRRRILNHVMPLLYRIAADLVLVLHAAYVLFVVLGLVLILVGIWRKWEWIRNFWFRVVHLGMIGVVVAESWIGMVCPLTTLENWLRREGGEQGYQGDFIANWVHDLLFFELPAWVFAVGYTLFGAAVLATFFSAPPRWPKR